jgi:hypothetical protein
VGYGFYPIENTWAAHPCSLIWIYTIHFKVRNDQMNQKGNSADSDQTARMITGFLTAIFNGGNPNIQYKPEL